MRNVTRNIDLADLTEFPNVNLKENGGGEVNELHILADEPYPKKVVIENIINFYHNGISLKIDSINYTGEVGYNNETSDIRLQNPIHMGLESGSEGHPFKFWNTSGEAYGTIKYQKGEIIFENVEFTHRNISFGIFGGYYNTTVKHRFICDSINEISKGIINLYRCRHIEL